MYNSQPMGQPGYTNQPMYNSQPMSQPSYTNQPMYNSQPMSQPGYNNQPNYNAQPMSQPNYNAQPMGQFNYNSQPMSQPLIAQNPNTHPINKQHFVFCNDPLVQLSQARSAIIKQEVELIEILTGCETKNRYHCYIITHSGEFIYLFKCKEESSWCVRNCCSSEARPFSMKVRHVSNQSDLLIDDYNNYYALLERPFKCTCFCFERPEMSARNANTLFGKVVEPFTCFNPEYHVKDSIGNTKWKIHAECCQCGICCRSSLGKCSEATFPIYSGDKSEFNPNHSDGHIKKLSSGCQEIVSDADSFELIFPQNATPEEKLMLISTVLMIDYRYYEDNGNNQNKSRRI